MYHFFYSPIYFVYIASNIAELDATRYGLHTEQYINLRGICDSNANAQQTKDVELYLKKLYCGTVSAEFDYIESEPEQEWLQVNYEKYLVVPAANETKCAILELMVRAQVWDQYVAKKFPTYKRYGGEGAETMFAFFRQIFSSATDADLQHIVLGMPHRGKLNLLTTMLNTRPAKIFRKVRGLSEFPDDAKCMGDIASHFREFSI